MKERVNSQSFDWRKPAGATLAVMMLGLNSCAPNEATPDDQQTRTDQPSAESTDFDPVVIEPVESPSPTDLPPPGISVETPASEPTSEPEPEPSFEQPMPGTIETDPPVEIPTVEPEPDYQPPVPNPTESAPSDHNHAVDCMVQKCIALTFDDGPGPYTGDLLDYLDEHDAKATFFLVGNRVGNYSDAAIAERDGGHQIANHSWDHDDLTNKSLESAQTDIEKTNDEIERVTGIRPTVMRPPYGATNQSLVEAIGQPQILWSVDTEDWKHHDSEYVANYVIQHAQRGDIILMHDIHKTSVEAVPEILDRLSGQGYVFVTVDDMLGSDLAVDRYNQQAL